MFGHCHPPKTSPVIPQTHRILDEATISKMTGEEITFLLKELKFSMVFLCFFVYGFNLPLSFPMCVCVRERVYMCVLVCE